jgi:hypothetical protein
MGGDTGRGIVRPFFMLLLFAVDLVLFDAIFILVDSHDPMHMRNNTFSPSCQ